MGAPSLEDGLTRARARQLYEKLIALSERPGTPAEGEAAARRAAELKRQFGLTDEPRPTPWPDRVWTADPISGGLGLFRRPDAGEGVISRDPVSWAFRDDTDR